MIDVPIRLVATDLDGTLLHDDGTISPRTRRAISRAQEAGITVVLVTARPPRTLRLLAEQAGVNGPAICCNGAVANAHPDILAIADEVTAANNDDGVAHILERFVT